MMRLAPVSGGERRADVVDWYRSLERR
jgi:hypothetical protein